MEVPEKFQQEVLRLNRLGYFVCEVDECTVKLEKYVKPSKLRIAIWILVSGLIPIIAIFFLLIPARVYYFFKGERYVANLKLINGEVDVS